MNKDWIKVLKATDKIMPLENRYYNDLEHKFNQIDINSFECSEYEIKFESELFLKSKESPINCFTEDICSKLGLSLDLYKKREPT